VEPFFSLSALGTALHHAGPWAALTLVALQALQVVVFWIPGEVVQVAGGMVFGPWVGTALRALGTGLGGLAAFVLARRWGRARIAAFLATREASLAARLVRHPRLDLVLAFLFFLPYFPKDVLCYAAGVSEISLWRFFWVTEAARLPSLFWSSWVGDQALQSWGLLTLAAGAAGLLALGLWALRRPLVRLLGLDR